MKEGWVKKKLGDICEIYQPKTIATKDLLTHGKYFVYGANGIIGKYDKYNHEQSELLMTCRGATCGSINISKPQSWINGNAMVIHPFDKDILNLLFLKYFLKGTDLSQIITGAAQPQITRQALSPLYLLLPPLPEQKQIVSELDCLQGIIDKKKEQLQELDKLAQSIFYTMFGDPVENEKGWDIDILNNACSSITDGDHMPPPKADVGIPFITISNIEKNTRKIDFTKTFYVPIEYYNNLKQNRIPHKGDILYTVTGSYGIAIEMLDNKPFCFQRHIGLLRPKDFINSTYLCYWANNRRTKEQADKIATGIAQKTVSLKNLKQFKIILPPLPLQQEFADKISAIEQQKARIAQSLQDTETLFNSRMDYYFG